MLDHGNFEIVIVIGEKSQVSARSSFQFVRAKRRTLQGNLNKINSARSDGKLFALTDDPY